ncbi:hypothetical protein VCHA31O73_360013 [Vibrio chagasii]|nr:hypothetical protein VCHA31O73_360013 [Vibrio chagasii]
MIKTLTKADLAERFIEQAATIGYPIKGLRAKFIVDEFFALLFGNVAIGKAVYFPRMGKIISTVKKGGRPVRNPKNGDTFAMPPTVNIKFSAMKTKGDKFLRSEAVIMLTTHFTGAENVRVQLAEMLFDEFVYMLVQVKRREARIEIRGFASFIGKKMKPKIARNPKTGESVEVGSQVKITMKAGKQLQAAAIMHQLG